MPNTKHQSPGASVWDESTASWNWLTIVIHTLLACGGRASLHMLNSVIKRHPRIPQCPEWRAKVGWVLKNYSEFYQARRNVWLYVLEVTPELQAKSEELRARLLAAGIPLES